ncbi:hypothetical protein R6Q59_005469 [Mikania micrantha]
MPFKISHLLAIFLCIYLLSYYLELSTAAVTTTVPHHLSTSRKMLTSEFNFALYLNHHHHHHHQNSLKTREIDYAIDPRYGIEKRLVPSGPNPLHH